MHKAVANRKRSNVRRYPGGQIHHADRVPRETEEDVKATALEARLRQDWGVDLYLAERGNGKNLKEARRRMDDPLRGYALGRLLLVGRNDLSAGIDSKQHDAGEYFIRLYRAMARLNNWPSPNPRSIGADMVGGGLSTHPEDSDEYIADIKRRWADMYRALYDLNQAGVYEVMRAVLIEDRQPESLAGIGSLRLGLNAINRVRGV